MKYLLPLIALSFCLSSSAATFPNRFTTNADNVLVNGSTLTNLPYTSITTPTTNSVYDASVAYSGNLTTIQDGAANTIDISAYANKTWYVFSVTPRILTNTVLPKAYFFYSPDADNYGPGWIFYTNLDATVDNWFGGSSPLLGTNGSVPAASGWSDGQGTPLANNLFQFSTNSTVTYPRTDLAINRQTNLVINTAGGSVNITNYPSSPAKAVIEMVSGTSASRIIFAPSPGSAGDPADNNAYGSIWVIPDHLGAASVANSELVILGQRMAFIWGNVLQLGVQRGFPSGEYAQMHNDYVTSAGTPTNYSKPLFFRTKVWNGAAEVSHFAGIYSRSVTTNGTSIAAGTGYLALGNRQRDLFEAESSTFSLVSTNEAVRLWWGGSNTVEVLNGLYASAGLASVATNLYTVTPTGFTNSTTRSIRVQGLTGVALVQTNTALNLGFSRGTITVPSDIILQPGEFFRGTSVAAQGAQDF